MLSLFVLSIVALVKAFAGIGTKGNGLGNPGQLR
jgi:hypothetical protein